MKPELKTPQRWAIICGNYINAYSIVRSLQILGWQGPIVCIKEHEGASLMDVVKGVEVWGITLRQPSDLLAILAERIPAGDPKVIFFTDERFHEVFRAEGEKRLPNSRFLVGSTTCLDAILDRFALYQLIEQNHLTGTPRTIESSENPFEQFGKSFFIRVKKTWDGLVRLPRVQLIESEEQKRQVEAQFMSVGLKPIDWCYQEVLSLNPLHNVSICGWHAAENPLYFATHHLLRHPDECGNGDVTELMDPPADLFTATARLLNKLEYEGPFELEFVLDQNTNEYKVIELNPRFWMQHGLLEEVTGHALVQRYIHQENIGLAQARPEIHYWANAFYALFRLAKFDWRIVRYITSRRILVAPNWLIALQSGFSLFGQKLCQMIFK